jgi:hypothetical protein
MCDIGRTTYFLIVHSCPPKSNTGLRYSGPSRFSRTEVEAPQAVVNPHSEPLILSLLPTVPLLAPPLSPRAHPTCPPRSGAHVRVTPVVVVPNRPEQSLVIFSKTSPDPPKKSSKLRRRRRKTLRETSRDGRSPGFTCDQGTYY